MKVLLITCRKLTGFGEKSGRFTDIAVARTNGRVVAKSRHTFCQLGSRLDTSHTQDARINEHKLLGRQLGRVRTVSHFSCD